MAFVQYNNQNGPPADANGNEIATSYKIYWGTDALTATSGGSSVQFAAQGGNNSFYSLKGLTNGPWYFKMSALVGTTESAKTAVFGPVTIGALATNGITTFNVSGTVTLPVAANGPMLILLHPPHGNGNVYFTQIGRASCRERV